MAFGHNKQWQPKAAKVASKLAKKTRQMATLGRVRWTQKDIIVYYSSMSKTVPSFRDDLVLKPTIIGPSEHYVVVVVVVVVVVIVVVVVVVLVVVVALHCLRRRLRLTHNLLCTVARLFTPLGGFQ